MNRTIQKHHISYDPPETVTVFQGEHYILSLIDRYERKSVSKGFIKALKIWIKQNEKRAIDLDSINKDDQK